MRAGHPAPYGRVQKPTFRPWHMALYENLVNQWSVQFFPIKIAISWKNSPNKTVSATSIGSSASDEEAPGAPEIHVGKEVFFAAQGAINLP